MKRGLLMLMLIAGPYWATGQIFQFGIKGGIGFQNLNLQDFNGGNTWESLDPSNGNLGWHIGFQSRINLLLLKIKPELYFTRLHSQGTLKAKSGSNQDDIDYNFFIDRLDLPVLLAFELGPVGINVGPVVSTYMSNTAEQVTINTEGLGFGYQLGAGIKLGSITLDARYEGAFHNAVQSFTIGGTNFQADQRPSQLMFSVGYFF
jgi:hypothetical protein